MLTLSIIYPALLLCLGIWVVDNFILARNRLIQAEARVKAGDHDIKSLVAESQISQICRFAFYGLMISLIFASIKESADLSLLMIVGILVLVVFWFLDLFLLRKPRKNLIHASGNESTQALAKKDVMLAEYAKSFVPLLLLVFILRSFLAEPFQIPSGSMKPTLEIGDFVVVNKFEYGVRLPVVGTELFDLGDPKAGDIIVFKPPHEPTIPYIKRLIGVPGDHVRYDYINKTLFVNEVAVQESVLPKFEMTENNSTAFSVSTNGVEHTIYESNLSGGQPLWRLEMDLAELKRMSSRIQATQRKAYELEVLRMESQIKFTKGVVVPEGQYFALGDNRDNSADSRVWGFVDEDQIQGRAMAIWLHWPEFLSIPSFKNNRLLSKRAE